MEIRAVVFDLDGTAIPVDINGLPSDKVISAVAEAQKLVKVSCATGRPYYNAKDVLDKLKLNEPCIVSGGSQIVDPQTGSVLWEKAMGRDRVLKVLSLLKEMPYKIYTSDNPVLLHPKEIKNILSERVIYVMYVNPVDAAKMVSDFGKIEGIAAHAMASWEKGKLDVHVTHANATKKNAMKELLRMLDIDPAYVMTVGDGGNDLPLFEFSGLKIAMGNASEALKAKASHVTLPVSEDGLAVALEQYVIKSGKIGE